MKTIFAPNGDYIIIPDGRIMTFGLDKVQNELVEAALPLKGYELYNTEVPADLIAISASALIINAEKLNKEELDMLFEYYSEVGDCTDETVYWIGFPEAPKYLRAVFKCYKCFEDFAVNIKYHLLTAHSKSKKAKEFSKKLSDCLMILSLIKSKPGIRTQEIAGKLEVSTRTVQRYISTLQVAGEWIDYDQTRRGWYLQNGVSNLFGEF